MKVGDLVKNKFNDFKQNNLLVGIVLSLTEPINDSGAFVPVQFAWVLWASGNKVLSPINCLEVVGEV